jgi:hypothetical protein
MYEITFEQNLELAKDENPTMDLRDQIALAIEWTIAEVTSHIQHLGEQRWAAHLEATNKVHFG